MINSMANKQVKTIVQLIKKSKARRDARVFVVEGIRMFREVPKERLVKTYVSEDFLKKSENQDLLKGTEYEVLADSIFASISDTQTPQGIMCIVKQMEYTMGDLLTEENPHLMVLENLQDPGNLGTIFRTAEGAGINGIIMSSDTVDIYNPKTVRSTMGSLYRMPFIYEKDLKQVLVQLKEKNIKVYAAHLKGKNPYYKEDFRPGTAFLIGNEGNGLSDGLSEMADTYIRIPMEGQVESLNAAVAAAILMYEVKRQKETCLKVE